MSKHKKNLKLINELYDYSKVLDQLPPRGDGAKRSVAVEVHQVSMQLFKRFEKSSEQDRYKIALMLLELCEQMLLDKIDDGLTVEEMFMYE